jgi:hypothetical protein
MATKLRVEQLADHPEVLPILKEWFETEWESYYGPASPGDAQSDLVAYANREKPGLFTHLLRHEDSHPYPGTSGLAVHGAGQTRR